LAKVTVVSLEWVISRGQFIKRGRMERRREDVIRRPGFTITALRYYDLSFS